jgi:2-polyprenyl-3-methyl-5-hydroxy-6-metoxy-1,4-benzoquinol methylase
MEVLCPFCSARSSLKTRAIDLNNRVTEIPFDYYNCSMCGLVFLSPIPDDLAKYYRSDYIAYDIPTSLAELEAKAEKVRFRIDIVKKFAPITGRLLEIGPSYGGFSFLAKQAGFTVDVVEMDSECCRFLQDVVGVNATCSNNVPLALEDKGQYDVIALWHVIEHFAEPWKVLDSLVNHLRPNGIIVISAPNPDSFQFKLFGRLWVHLDAPRHVSLMPVAWLTRFLEERGVRKIMVTTTDPDGRTLNKSGWIQSSLNLVSNRSVNERSKAAQLNVNLLGNKFSRPARSNWRRLVQGNILERAVIFILSIISSLILRPYEATSLRGCAYTLVVKKDSINE